MTDMSTGVANQDYLMHFAGGLIASGQIANYNIIFFNVHNFKYVNKVFSYEQGDIILRNYAQHIKNIMGNDEIVARLGGDNFVLVFHKERREKLIEQLQNIRIHHQWQMKEREFVFGATIGVSNLNGITVPRAIMGRASIAYQAARQKGVGSVVEFSPEIEQEILANQSIVSNYRQRNLSYITSLKSTSQIGQCMVQRLWFVGSEMERWYRQCSLFRSWSAREACVNLITMYWKVSVLF